MMREATLVSSKAEYMYHLIFKEFITYTMFPAVQNEAVMRTKDYIS